MRITRSMALALLCAAATNTCAAAFTDGSFESLALADGQQRMVDNASPKSTLDGWTSSGRVVVRDSLATDPRPATDGDNLVFMNNGGSLSQTFDTVAGLVYTVSFDYSKNKGVASVLVDGSVAEMLGGGVVQGMQAAPGFAFVASGAQTTLSFVAQMAQSNGGIGRLYLDDVVVAAPVPENGGAAMLSAGVLLLGLLFRRRIG